MWHPSTATINSFNMATRPDRRRVHLTETPQRRESDRSFRDQKWHFDKRVSVDTFVAIFGMAIVVGGPVMVWGRAMEGRVLGLEVIQDQRARAEEQRDRDVRDQRLALSLRLDKFDDQLTALRIGLGQLAVQINGKSDRGK